MIAILSLLIISMASLSEALTTAETYCQMTNVCPSSTSIACKYVANPAMKCSGTLLALNKADILHQHNYRRNMIASGKISGFNQASRMATMKWSTQLEQMAKYNVMTCVFGHDTCRNTNLFTKSGQNLYQKSGTAIITLADTVSDAHVAFFSERVNCNMNIIRSYQNVAKPIGHFTAMVKWDSDYVGCAANKFTKNGLNYILFACNYASTNVLGLPIYYEGTAASKCTTGKNPSYPGLCSVNEKYGHG